MADVQIRLLGGVGDTVSLTLPGFLGGERFTKYRDACASCGARYNSSARDNRAPLAQVPELLRLLGAAGLTVSVAPEIATALRQDADEMTRLRDEGEARLQAADARLAGTGRKLYPYQRSGVRWLAPRSGALLADEMGTGKTITTLLALPERAAVLVVAPSAVSLNWAAETRRWRPDLSPVVLKSKATWRLPRPGEVVISTYGLLPPPGEDQLPAPAGCVLLADEAHLLKNSKTARNKAWTALKANVRAQGGRVWLLTGTPLVNRPPELWAVLRAADLAEAAFGSWPKFVSLFHGSAGRWGGYEWGGEVSEDVPAMLQRVSLRRMRRDVLPDLPVKTRQVLPVNGLPAATIRECDKVVELLKARGIDLEGLGPGADLGKLISGPVFELMSRARALLATAKLPAALEIVESHEEEGEPLVVVSAHVEPLRVVGAREGWGLIVGDTSPEDRARIAEEFQTGKLRGVALSYAAGGVGITLTRAARMLAIDAPWTPALLCQAEDRIVRIGQTRGCVITRLVATHPLDARVDELLEAKAELIEASVEASAVEADHVHADPSRALAEAAETAAALVERANAEAAAAPPAPARRTAPYTAADVHEAQGSVGKFRAASGPLELWAARSVLTLSGLDSDRAAIRNGVGFNGTDSSFGNSLADNLRRYGRLSDAQWGYAVKIARRYPAQVGAPPA